MSSQTEIDAILAEAEQSLRRSPSGAATAVPPASSKGSKKRREVSEDDLTRILNIEVPVIVRLAHRTMRVREIMQFASGSIIEFDKLADAELDLMINNEVIGYGQAVKVGENFGLRVLHVLSLREKIEAMAGRSAT
jgi:flagellar motor switch protein FliN/FliY